jgi:hypothetical protein
MKARLGWTLKRKVEDTLHSTREHLCGGGHSTPEHNPLCLICTPTLGDELTAEVRKELLVGVPNHQKRRES